MIWGELFYRVLGLTVSCLMTQQCIFRCCLGKETFVSVSGYRKCFIVRDEYVVET